MSDLLPLLVAAGLRDKTLTDAKEELDGLHKRLDATTKVEIIRTIIHGNGGEYDDEVVVYASGQFEDGKHWGRNEFYWEVGLPFKGMEACKVSDLEHCHICVGGGFPFATLNQTNQNTSGHFIDIDGDCATIELSLFQPFRTSIVMTVHGWPRDEWLPLARSGSRSVILRHFAKTVGTQYPKATIEFNSVSFWTHAVRGAFKRLLSPKRREEAEIERAKRFEEAQAERRRKREEAEAELDLRNEPDLASIYEGEW